MSGVDPKGRKRNELDRIEREIRDWPSRPPARSPRVARTRVLARIEEPQGTSFWGRKRQWTFAAAAAMVVVLAVGLLLPRAPVPPPTPPVKMASSEPPASEGGLLVYELESGTKLYMALAMTSPFADTTMEGN